MSSSPAPSTANAARPGSRVTVPTADCVRCRFEALCIQKDAQGQGSVLGVLSPATGDVVAPAQLVQSSDETGVDFAFANDQHSDERMALEQALEEMRGEAARLSHEAENERGRVQQVLEELERARATTAEHHAQKNQIEERHRAAEVRIEQLTGEAGELRGERQKLQRELDEMRAELKAQAKAQAEAMVRAEAADQERARIAEAAASTQSGAEKKTKELAAELKAVQARAEANEKALKAELDKVRADAVRVAEALEAQGRNSKGAEAALASARDALQARLQEVEAQSADLETRRQAAVARVAELEEKRRAEQAALASANKHEAELEQQLKAARDEAARAASERDGVKSELGRVHESHRAAEDDAALKGSEAVRIKSELEGRIQQLQAELDRVHADQQAAQGALENTRAQADGTRGELDQLRTDLARQRAEADQRGAELAQRQAELGAVRGELDQVRGELQQLRGELDTTRGARDAHAREVDDVKAAVAKAAGVIDELRQGREAVDARAHAATGELDELRREVESRGQHAADLQRALERERAEAREHAAETERQHQDALARLMKQIDESREFQASAAASRGSSERGRRRPGERLGQLASAMANDLHGIVNTMVDDGRKLLAELPDGSTVRAQAEQSLQSANRAGQLVRHLLRLSEREARATKGSDPNSLVRANEPMLRQLAGPDIDLRFELAPGLPSVECDADELAGLLSTLVVTVRGALPLGGSIRVSTLPPRKDGGRRRNDTSLALAVMAEGYGMVSVPTTVCDEVVTRSGGTFGAQVDLKGGTTTFTAYLPVDQSAEAGVTNIA